MWETFTAVFANPFIFFVGIQQVVGGAYSWWLGDWRIAIINVMVGIANVALSSLHG